MILEHLKNFKEYTIIKLKCSDVYWDASGIGNIYDILINEETAGIIDIIKSRKSIEVSIELNKKFRNKGFGVLALQELRKLYPKKKVTATFYSKQSLYTFMKVFGKPLKLEYNFENIDLQTALKLLPEKSKYTANGILSSKNQIIAEF